MFGKPQSYIKRTHVLASMIDIFKEHSGMKHAYMIAGYRSFNSSYTYSTRSIHHKHCQSIRLILFNRHAHNARKRYLDMVNFSRDHL